jgi:GT2 family glycosyltransferase
LRPSARGKSIFLGDEKLYVRGVTYGTFSPDEDDHDYPSVETVAQDFAMMAANGVNTVRTYTVPPLWLLDLAERHGLWVMVGIPWEEHIAFLDEPGRAASIRERIRTGVRACAGHPAVFCYTIGNEIPASIVRWHGRSRIERFLHQLYRVAKEEDPEALVTYVNYPSTEYLQLDFTDIICFNIFLESGPQFEAYLSRLQNISGDRPLIVTETGLDSRRHSEEAQARALDWQVRSAFGAGCAGVFVFSWTDEWHRGGYDIDDWDFGLVDRERMPKRALDAVAKAFSELPFPESLAWPRVSVVVCTYNGAKTLPDCLEELRNLKYPDYEVIVVNDGSSDNTDEIVSSYGVRLVSTENQGLGTARNLGMEAATGEIIAYIDSDAYPDPHWLTHLAVTFMRTSHAGIGGPNIPPPDDGEVAECVAKAPGGPCHVLVSDGEAEHIPGCNMAFRKDRLEAIGGFDPLFCIAGDDVDICWRLQNEGWTVGFSPGAVVWHHRRRGVRSYLKQQYEYGKAEALLERKWPARYNRVGHLAWSGRVYGNGANRAVGWRRWRIYYGTWGSGLFQSVYQRAPGALATLALVPEWYLVIAALAALSALGILWPPLLLGLPLLGLAAGALAFESALGSVRASFAKASRSKLTMFRLQLLTSILYMVQPFARLSGRLRFGLAPWRRRSATRTSLPLPRTRTAWSERWQSSDERLERIEAELQRTGGAILKGGDYDRWDLQVRGGLLGVARMRMAIEEHGGGRQLIRVRSWPKWSRVGLVATLWFGLLSAAAALNGELLTSAILGAVALFTVVSSFRDCATATGLLLRSLDDRVIVGDDEPESTVEPEPELAPEIRFRADPADLAVRSTANGHVGDNGSERAATPAPFGGLPSASRIIPFSSDVSEIDE